MAWSGGTFTRANPTWASDAAGGTGIEPGRHDAQDNDFTTGINQCINKDGSNAMTGNLNLNTNKIVGLANGTADTDGVSLGQAKAGIDIQTTTTNRLLSKFSADSAGLNQIFQKSRGATVGTNTVVQNGDSLGAIVFQGANGTGYNVAAAISCKVDGTPGLNDMPGMLTIATTPDGSSSAVDAIVMDNQQRVGIGTASLSATHRMTVSGDIRVTNQGLSYPGVATYIGGTTSANNIGFAWDSPNIWAAVDNSVSAIVGTVSDYRLKDGFTPVSTTLNKIKNLNVGTYQPKEFDGTVKNTTCCGVLAHEAAVQFPDLVTGEKDAETEDGKPRYQSFNYAGLTPYLVVAIKELLAKVEELEARLPEVSEPA